MKYDIKFDEGSGFYEWNKPCFLINKKDERYKNYLKYKKKHGISPDQTWSLKHNIGLFLVPRLKAFKEMKCGYPSCFNNIEEWNEVLDKMIFSFESLYNDEFYIPNSYIEKYDKEDAFNEYHKDIEEGFKLFSEYIESLWW